MTAREREAEHTLAQGKVFRQYWSREIDHKEYLRRSDKLYHEWQEVEKVFAPNYDCFCGRGE